METSGDALSLSPRQRYFREMKNYRLLDREEERDLARRYRQENDQTALHRLVTGNLRLVVKIANEFWNPGNASLLDLIQEGNVGLIQAAKKFDPSKQVKFSYYAGFWIKAQIYKFLMDNYRTVRIGTTQSQRKLFFKLRKTRTRLAKMGIEPTPDAIAGHLNVRRKDVLEMQMRLDRPDLSLNAPLRDSKHGEQLDRFRSLSPSPAQRFEKRELRALLRRNTLQFKEEHLDSREKVILEQRILANRPDTLRSLGIQFGVSRERIRQVEKRIIEKLRQYLSRNLRI
jgi:RNA polymerase sigma-32 factor